MISQVQTECREPAERVPIRHASELRKVLESPCTSRIDVIRVLARMPEFTASLSSSARELAHGRRGFNQIEGIVALLGHSRIATLLDEYLSAEPA